MNAQAFLAVQPFVRLGYFRHPDVPGTILHSACGHLMADHGWIDSFNLVGYPDGINVCPSGPFNPTLVAEIERLTGEPTEDEIDRAADVLVAHEYRVTSDWYPFCVCGWRADQTYDVASYDRHVARAALRAARGLS